MTLTSIKPELVKASRNGYAIPLIDVIDTQSVEGVVEAASYMQAPTIIGVYQSLLEQSNARAFTKYIIQRISDTTVPISLMLDHGASIDQCLKALDYGFTDVMYDGSLLQFEENIKNTRRIVESGHAAGAGVEAELGHVGLGKQYASYGGRGLGFTDPEVVFQFVAETEVDFLAIAFGNAHGLYQSEPRLDYDLLRDVRKRVDIPLVMHGGTGLLEDQYRQAIQAGISKINVATLIINQATVNIRHKAGEPGTTVFDFQKEISQAYRDHCCTLYQTFGTQNRA